VLPAWLTETADGVVLRILVQPKASRTEVVGPHGEPPRLRIRVAAPPVDGAANEELLRFLKKALGVPGSQLELVRGHSSKQKDVLCKSLEGEKTVSRLLRP
jgi:uncharacterized protein (TIGR00251 family)